MAFSIVMQRAPLLKRGTTNEVEKLTLTQSHRNQVQATKTTTFDCTPSFVFSRRRSNSRNLQRRRQNLFSEIVNNIRMDDVSMLGVAKSAKLRRMLEPQWWRYNGGRGCCRLYNSYQPSRAYDNTENVLMMKLLKCD